MKLKMTNYLLLAADDGSAAIGILIFFGLALLCYILPGLIASARHHHNVGAIWALTIFLGWSFLGWVIAFVWAFTNPPAQTIVVNNQSK